jgi:hypothetical protein
MSAGRLEMANMMDIDELALMILIIQRGVQWRRKGL